MITLSAIQDAFQSYLIDKDADTIEDLTVDNSNITAKRRLKIYYDAYRLRLIEILQSDFPKLHTLIGDEAFETLSRKYIASYTSHHFSVRYFGQHLMQFLNENEPYIHYPYLTEMAAFEWTITNTLDASDASVLNLSCLHTVPPEKWGDLKIIFHPSCQILNFKWDVPQCWQSIENQTPVTVPSELIAPITWIFWREGLTSQFRSLLKEQVIILSLFREGCTFSEICEALCEIIEEDLIPSIALGFIQQCLIDGFISEISYD